MSSSGAPVGPSLPPGEFIDLPERGRLFVRRTAGPPGSPTVVLLHGWTVTADLNWYPAFEPLSQRASVVAFDHRGHGQGLATPAVHVLRLRGRRAGRGRRPGHRPLRVRGLLHGRGHRPTCGPIGPRAGHRADLGGHLPPASEAGGCGRSASRCSRWWPPPPRLAPVKLRHWGWEQTVFQTWIGTNISRWAQAEGAQGRPPGHAGRRHRAVQLRLIAVDRRAAHAHRPDSHPGRQGGAPTTSNRSWPTPSGGEGVYSYQGGHASVVTDFDRFWGCMRARLWTRWAYPTARGPTAAPPPTQPRLRPADSLSTDTRNRRAHGPNPQ